MTLPKKIDVPTDCAISHRTDVTVPQVKFRKGTHDAADFPAWAVEKALKVGVAKEHGASGDDDWGDGDDGQGDDGGGDPDNSGDGDNGDGSSDNGDGSKKTDAKSMAKAMKGNESKLKKGVENK